MASSPKKWPVLRTYDQAHLREISLPLGGIGTGTIGFGGRGQLRDFEMANTPAKGFQPQKTFFALWAKPQGGEAVTRCLEGIVDQYQGADGSRAPNHGLPRFRSCSFETAYPFGQAILSDPDVPVSVRIQAFNPLVPGDVDASSLPVAVLRFTLANRTAKPLKAAICGNLHNAIGYDPVRPGNARVRHPKGNFNAFHPAGKKGAWAGLFLGTKGVPKFEETCGSMALATDAPKGVTFRTDWAHLSWGDTLLDFWDDFSADGKLEDRPNPGDKDDPMASLCAPVSVPAKGSASVTFLVAWHFPNRQAWNPIEEKTDKSREKGPNWVGNYYATLYEDAWDVVGKTVPQLPALEERTRLFVESFLSSDLPGVVKEAALFNLSTLRTQTCFRIASGKFLAWEGCGDDFGWCFGSCTHVWNYETATHFLFGALARDMRDTEFAFAMRDDGHMSFRVGLPVETRGREFGFAAADGQMGCLMRLYNDWKLSGDEAMLEKLWPNARKALEFCWLENGWDGNRDGVMEGCQHNTMDVEYYGPNPQMQFWYLGALRACEEMARHLGEDDFAGRCRALFEKGSAFAGRKLFNGEYYEHLVRPLASEDAVVPGIRVSGESSVHPVLQLGAGCLVDQLAGQYMAHVCGLGPLDDPRRLLKASESVKRFNYRKNLFGHFNHLRTFALNDESATLMASYPRGRRPKRPFPYYNEVMTGFEYTAAIELIFEGKPADGLEMISSIRARYDGARRNPFDEAECGHHYARAMASWSAVVALQGFQYSALDGTMAMAPAGKPKPGRHFWATGDAWGLCDVKKDARKGWTASIRVMQGNVNLESFLWHGRPIPFRKRACQVRR
ncbi:MAG: GH116 family glycosyl-hydrolase [Kiritimatiellia bacterium]